ncbi:MAG: hypothetical protein JXR60_06670 [Bacteroidales bacterium]|nr:hypothetical protein [Bacteroidales bacterium]
MLLIFSECKEPEDSIADTPVDFRIYLNDPIYRDLRTVGNSLTVTGGHAGIVIYRLSQDEFLAFDRLCPYEKDTECRIYTEDDDLVYRCECCNTPYLMIDGIGQSEGETDFPGSGLFLKAYRTYFDGVNEIRITNY